MVLTQKSVLVLLGIVVLAGSVWVGLRWSEPGQTPSLGSSITLVPAASPANWSRALEPQQFRFPADHGPHPDYQTEWWYYTGNLESQAGRRFAYQLTFFRRGLTPVEAELGSALAMQSLYFAHFAVTDVEAQKHLEWERFARGAAGLAGGQGAPFRVWLDDWSAEGLDPSGDVVRLRASADDVAIELELETRKPLVLHGDAGLSAKSEVPGNASYYLSFTRLHTSGSLRFDAQDYRVDGLSWFDHEWSTSALGKEAVGWDWFSLQMDNGSELMLFRIRNQDGSFEPVSSGTLVWPDGSWHSLGLADFDIEVLDRWRSEQSGIEYPSAWRVLVPDAGLDLMVRPLVADQEMNLSIVYWEGAVEIEGQLGDRPLSGFGFVELTGYGRSMQGTF